jgi:hypothetical protein
MRGLTLCSLGFLAICGGISACGSSSQNLSETNLAPDNRLDVDANHLADAGIGIASGPAEIYAGPADRPRGPLDSSFPVVRSAPRPVKPEPAQVAVPAREPPPPAQGR